MQIWKYPLEAKRAQTITTPVGARMLTVMLQGETPCLWAMVEPKMPAVHRQIEAYPTGGEVVEPEGLVYIATTQDMNGSPLVFHFFERVSK